MYLNNQIPIFCRTEYRTKSREDYILLWSYFFMAIAFSAGDFLWIKRKQLKKLIKYATMYKVTIM